MNRFLEWLYGVGVKWRLRHTHGPRAIDLFEQFSADHRNREVAAELNRMRKAALHD